MNKKSLAMAMAAVTVVGSAAPVFAQQEATKTGYTVPQNKYDDVIKEFKKILGGTDGKGNGAPKIHMVYKNDDGKTINDVDVTLSNIESIKTQLKNLDAGELADFTVSKKGTTDQYSAGDLVSMLSDVQAGNSIATTIKNVTDKQVADAFAEKGKVIPATVLTGGGHQTGAEADYTDGTHAKTLVGTDKTLGNYYDYASATLGTNGDGKTTLTIPLKSAFDAPFLMKLSNDDTTAKSVVAEPIVLTEGKDKFDFTTPVVDATASAPKITGFKVADAAPGSDEYNVRVIAATEKVVTATSDSSDDAKKLAQQYVFDKDEIQKAIDVINNKDSLYGEFKADADGDFQYALYPDGKRLQNKSSYKLSNSYVEGPLGGADAPIKLVVKASSKTRLSNFIKDLQTYNNSYNGSTAVAGSDRIETAIEISKKYYNSTDKEAITPARTDGNSDVKNIVLVGSDAIVDGLVASPLASTKDAPLLLTSKDKLDSSVKSEIKRVLGINNSTGITNKYTVYIAGGKNSVSSDVEKELKDMGLKIVRLSGDDRYATSLEIADEIGLNNKAFVVGGTGLADAMSIASVAAYGDGTDATPIVVVDGKGTDLSSDAKDFLGSSDVDIIGGTASVSKDMENAIDKATGKAPERVKGEDRQATNAEVIKQYFAAGEGIIDSNKKVENFFVAKDGSTKEDQLVDALAIAGVAGNEKMKAPVVLATDNLSSDQSVALSKVSADPAKSLVQIGGGIADSVINKIKDLLSLN
ncbi:S-layer protein SlpA [Clostridioides difficile]|uniref:S-layer protein SlpA n=1 Tax=Clostridioides difficile TaxID=1496 RepID=UPI0009402F03|nr:S-layer protein SlpA [Clostridioides difficile]TQX31960.1 S-layer protein SlpA [Clostridioides difficile]